MIHGLAGQAHVFDTVASRLSKGSHVYCLDVRGRGESAWGNPDGYHTDNYVADLEAVRAALGLEQMALIGTSMGALISFYYASAYPEHVSCVVLNDTGPEIDPGGLARIAEYVGNAPSYFKDQKAVLKYYSEHYAPMVEGMPEEQIAEFARHNVRRDDTGLYTWKMDPAVRKFVQTAPSRTPWEAWKGVKCPVLLVRGANSDILSREGAEKAVSVVPTAKLVEVPNIGHAPTLMEPVALQALETFLGER
jgi:pimeloyl-ACP methyl ester carboxylesterase